MSTTSKQTTPAADTEAHHYFGYSDANDEANLREFFFTSEHFGRIKADNKKVGNFIVHGIKGSGKTAICNYIRDTHSNDLVFKIDARFSFDASEAGSYVGPIKGTLLSVLLAEVLDRTLAEDSRYSKSSLQAARSASNRLKDFLTALMKGVKFSKGPISVDIADILQSGLARFSKFKVEEYVDGLLPSLNERRAFGHLVTAVPGRVDGHRQRPPTGGV